MARSSARVPIGYIRDRTATYREKWNALHPNANAASHAAADRIGKAFGASDTTNLLGETVEVAMHPLHQNRVMAAEQAINGELKAARTDLQQLSRLQSAAQEDLFGNDTSTARQVDAKRAKLRESIRRIHGLVVGLPAAADDATRAVAERVKRAKATELSKIAAELNRQEIQDLQAKAHKVPGMDDSKMDAVFSQLAEPTPAYTEQQMAQLSSMRDAYEQRDDAVADLIREVTAIQEVMRDLSVLVVEQGSMVDRIDQNIVAAAAQIERGVAQVARAHESSKSGTMATCIFVLLVLVGIMFAVLVVKNIL